jgi:hypothetical protein
MLFVQCNQGNECDYNFLWSEWKSFGDVSYGNVCVEYVYFTTEVYYSNAPKTVVELVEVEPSSSSFSSSNFSFTALCIINVSNLYARQKWFLIFSSTLMLPRTVLERYLFKVYWFTAQKEIK